MFRRSSPTLNATRNMIYKWNRIGRNHLNRTESYDTFLKSDSRNERSSLSHLVLFIMKIKSNALREDAILQSLFVRCYFPLLPALYWFFIVPFVSFFPPLCLSQSLRCLCYCTLRLSIPLSRFLSIWDFCFHLLNGLWIWGWGGWGTGGTGGSIPIIIRRRDMEREREREREAVS